VTTTSESHDSSPRISIVVPAHDNGAVLEECLAAVRVARTPDCEIIVVDDASSDDTPARAASSGARVVSLSRNRGPAAARNEGARQSRGDILFFVDADVVVAPDAVRRVLSTLGEPSGPTATFGSYDARPRAAGTISQYRNLLHHFVHQSGSAEASTFWAGCGAMHRRAFEQVGGFDEQRYPKPSIEDIELGGRLREAGHRIRLDKQLQGTHLKRWTFESMVHTDLTRRAIPWARLLLERGGGPADLNLKPGQRASVVLTALAIACLPLSAWRSEAAVVAALAVLGVLSINRELFGFFVRARGWVFAAACVPLHLIHYLCSGLGYLYAWVENRTAASVPRDPRGIAAVRRSGHGR